jgi:hypothetical protein
MSDDKKIILLVFLLLFLFFCFYIYDLHRNQHKILEGATFTITELSNNTFVIDTSSNFDYSGNGVNIYNPQVSNTSISNNTTTTTSTTTTTMNTTIPTNFYGIDGKTANYNSSSNIIYIDTVAYTASQYNADVTQSTFYAPDGSYCRVYSDGSNYFIEVQPYNGEMYFLTSTSTEGLTSSSASPYSTAPYANLDNSYSYSPTLSTSSDSLYMLKSQVVPPVCPNCPDISVEVAKAKKEKCSPCPPCGRCPEPSYDCKLVPNYSSISENDIPSATVPDFPTFGQ